MRYILVFGILISGLGAVVFFPLNINEQYTCIFHQIFDHSHPVFNVVGQDDDHVHTTNVGGTGRIKSKQNAEGYGSGGENEISDGSHDSLLLDKYLDQYAILWWTNVGLLALSIFVLINLNRKIKYKKSGYVTQ